MCLWTAREYYCTRCKRTVSRYCHYTHCDKAQFDKHGDFFLCETIDYDWPKTEVECKECKYRRLHPEVKPPPKKGWFSWLGV